jgi:hypothetical protein
MVFLLTVSSFFSTCGCFLRGGRSPSGDLPPLSLACGWPPGANGSLSPANGGASRVLGLKILRVQGKGGRTGHRSGLGRPAWAHLGHGQTSFLWYNVVKNEKNELIPQRTRIGWRMCIDYYKLNKATKKDHFPLSFIDKIIERLANHAYFCFLDGYSGFMQIPIHPDDQHKTTLHALMECLHIEGSPSVYVTLRPLFNVA